MSGSVAYSAAVLGSWLPGRVLRNATTLVRGSAACHSLCSCHGPGLTDRPLRPTWLPDRPPCRV